jgi:hypothetical protein
MRSDDAAAYDDDDGEWWASKGQGKHWAANQLQV